MPRIVSDRAEKTEEMVVLASTLEEGKIPVGVYRIFLISLLGSIFAFFAALVVAYVYRAQSKQLWNPIMLPGVLWLSTMLIALSSFTFESARQFHKRGLWHVSSKFLLATAVLGAAFLASQLTAWRQLVQQGVFMENNPHSSFFYLFTGLHDQAQVTQRSRSVRFGGRMAARNAIQNDFHAVSGVSGGFEGVFRTFSEKITTKMSFAHVLYE